MSKDDDAHEDLPPELVGKIRFISSVAGLVLMAGLGTLAAVVIHKLWIAPNKTAEPVAMSVPAQLHLRGKVISASASGEQLTLLTDTQEVIIIDLASAREIRRFSINTP